jgi:hypothetical protein
MFKHFFISVTLQLRGETMFRMFDVMVLLSTLLTFIYSLFLWFNGDHEAGLYVGTWVAVVIGLGIYFKLLRIVHFVLYKNLDDKKRDT